MNKLLIALALLLCFVLSCKKQQEESVAKMDLKNKIDRFAPTELSADLSCLSRDDKIVLDKIVQSAELMDHIYLHQVWNGNYDLLEKLQKNTSEEGKLRYFYFLMNMGPWSQVDNNEAFVDGVPKVKPLGANFYPADLTRDEFENWVKNLSVSEKEKAKGFFYVIRRDSKGNLITVPYSNEYRRWLEPASKLLNEAAEVTTNKSLKKYLKLRAKAFLSNDYYESDVAWLELDSPIEVVIGPYETYTDELFGYKAAFEAFVALRDDEATKELEKLEHYLQEIENNLPIDPKYRNKKLAPLSPIRVVDLVYASGDGNHGVQTAAFNLPNDERIIRDKGAKRVMLKNVQKAKFEKVLIPIAQKVLDQSQIDCVSFDAFFMHILAHELMHGLGPHDITIAGKATNVRQELKELYSAIEEAKADITGLFALQYLVDKGVMDKKLEETVYPTFLASMFRSIRFGINEAHGKGVAIQFNYLRKQGAIDMSDGGRFKVNRIRIKDAVKKLTSMILTIEAEGDYNKAKSLIEWYGNINPTTQKTLDEIKDMPIDIRPVYKLIANLPNRIR